MTLTFEENKQYLESVNQSPNIYTPVSPVTPINEEEYVTEEQKEKGRKLKVDELLQPQYVNVMRDYLSIRGGIGKGVDKYSDEEVRDMYMSRMRDFDTSDVGILDESAFIYRVKKDEEKAQIAKEAYELYEQVGGVFTNGSTFSGLLEHAINIFDPTQSPSTYLGLGVGKVATASALKLGSKEAVKLLGKEVTIKPTVKKAATKGAVVGGIGAATITDATTASLLHDMYQDANIHIGVQEEYSKWATGFAALGGVIGGGVDLLSRTKLPSAVSGYAKGASNKIAEAADYADYYTAKPEVKDKVHKKIVESARTWTEKVLDGEIIFKETDGVSLQVDFLRTLFLGNSDQNVKGIGQILREEGLALNLNQMTKDKRITDLLTTFIESLDEQTAKGLVDAVEKPNAKGQRINLFERLSLNVKDLTFQEKLSSLIAREVSAGGATLNVFSQIARDLNKAKRQGSKVYLQTIAEEEQALDETRGKIAEYLFGEKGKILKAKPKEKLYDDKGKLIDNVETRSILGKSLAKTQYFRHFQSVWKRTVVAAFSTTMLNLKGLTGIVAIKTAEDLAEVTLRMGIASPVALIKLLKGDKQGAISQFYKSAVIMQNQTQRLRNLLDPSANAEMFNAIMKVDEDSAVTLNRYLTSGVEAGDNLDEVAKRFKFANADQIIFRRDAKGNIIEKGEFGGKLTLDEKKVKVKKVGTDNKWLRFSEGYVDAAQKVMLVRTADTFMKSQAYMGNLDRILRETVKDTKYNSAVKLSNEAVNNPKALNDFLRSEQFLNISAEATEGTLEDILSKSYRNRRGETSIIGTIAGYIEDFGNIPVLGTLMPFGRFFNNTIALTYDMTGGGVINSTIDLARAGKVSKKSKKKLKRGAVAGLGTGIVASYTEEGDDGPVQEFFEDVVRGAANYSLLGYAMELDLKKIEKGLKWKDHVSSAGDIINVTYDFPASQFFVLARFLNLKKQNREIPKDLRLELSEQFMYGQLTRNLGKMGNLTNVIDQATAGEWQKVSETAATTFLTPLSTTVSGFLRPFDPINRLSAYGTDAEAMDARLGYATDGDSASKIALNRMVYDSTRYLNNIFELFTGKQTAQSKKMISKEGDILPQSPFSDATGFRTEGPRTYTQTLLAEIGVEEWRVEQRMKTMFPEGDSLFKELIQPQLELQAEGLYKSKMYKEANPRKREVEIKKMLSRVKASIKRQMEANTLNKDFRSTETASFTNIRDIMKTKSRYRKAAIKQILGQNDASIEELKKLGETSKGIVTLRNIKELIKLMEEGEVET